MIKVILVNSQPDDLTCIRNELTDLDSVEIEAEFPALSMALTTILKINPDLIICEAIESGVALQNYIMNYRLLPPFIFTGKKDASFLQLKNAVAFLHKPFTSEMISHALEKYAYFKEYFYSGPKGLLPSTDKYKNAQYRKRIIVNKGQEYVLLATQEIACFYSQDRLTYVLDNCGNKYFINETLVKLQSKLDPTLFFHASRNFVVNVDAIKKFKQTSKGEIEIIFINERIQPLVLNPENAAEFGKWIKNS